MTGCTINLLSDHTGVEVLGADLSRPVDDATRMLLNRAFVDHGVLVVRDQLLVDRVGESCCWPDASDLLTRTIRSESCCSSHQSGAIS